MSFLKNVFASKFRNNMKNYLDQITQDKALPVIRISKTTQTYVIVTMEHYTNLMSKSNQLDVMLGDYKIGNASVRNDRNIRNKELTSKYKKEKKILR